MKSTWKRFFLLSALLPMVWVSCNDDDPMPDPEQIGGKGGQATISVIPQFEGVDVDSCQVYIIYNSLDNTEMYNDSIWVKRIEEGRPTAIFTELKQGNYYLFGKGWDIKRSVPVEGGIGHTIEEPYASKTIELAVRQ